METKEFFKTVSLEMNKNKSATNSQSIDTDAVFLESKESYKYLGIIEIAYSFIFEETFQKVKREILNIAKRLCATKLNVKNYLKQSTRTQFQQSTII